MKRINIAEPSFTYEPENPEGFRVGTFRFGRLVGAEELGTLVPRLRVSLDPLSAEATRGPRKRRVLALVAVAAVAAGAVLGFELLGAGAVTPLPASLTVLAVNEHGGGRALFHLRCDPAGGNVAAPVDACAAIAAQPSLVTHPKPFISEFGNAWYFRITGTLDGKAVHVSGDSTWTPQMELIGKLGLAGPHGQPLHLERQRHGKVAMNRTRTFPPGVLRSGDVVACGAHPTSRGPALAMGVPVHRGSGFSTMGAMAGVMAIRIRDGAVTASCLARNRLPLDKRGRTTYPAGWPP